MDPVQKLCSYTEVVNITAEDEDGDPNSAPFTFSFVDETSMKKWRAEPLNGMDTCLFFLYWELAYCDSLQEAAEKRSG